MTIAKALAKLDAVVAIVIESLSPAAADATAAAAAAAALLLPLPELLVLLLTAATAERRKDEGSMNTKELPEATLNPKNKIIIILKFYISKKYSCNYAYIVKLGYYYCYFNY